MKCRVLEKGNCEITQGYSDNHNAVDIVGGGYTLDYVVAHSDGKIVFCQDGYGNMKGSTGNASYGNCVKIDHGNGYCTLYAHMLKGLSVKNGDSVKKGQKLGYMSDSGNANGGHLHFEVWKNGTRINPTEYLDKDIIGKDINVGTKYNIGDIVSINGVYVSSDSTEKLVPAITRGTITRIIEGARNPYLLDNGNIGWVNDDCIVNNKVNYLSNTTYTGVSIIDALKEIGVDSSYQYRARLAEVNDISDYRGTAEQNTRMLELLKNGRLKSV